MRCRSGFSTPASSSGSTLSIAGARDMRVRGFAARAIGFNARRTRMTRNGIATLVLALLASPFIPAAARAQRDTVLAIGGDVENAYVLSAAEFAKLPHLSVEATGHDGKPSRFEGVLVADLLRKAGVKFGGEMRGPRVALALVVGATDGYRAVFGIAELDSAFSDHTIMVSDRRDGAPTGAADGPLRVVATGDKRFARWVRQVNSLTVRKL